MRTAWDRAFKALSARLSLAQRKTNTVHQRAKLASAIIIPKLLYEGRHAWPSQDVVTEADNRIKNFIWRSSFARTDRAPAGWVGAAIAGLPDNLGGLGIPCIKTELMALGAHTVGKWALAENPLTQMIGDILQLPHGLQKRALVPRHCKIPCKLRKSIWETGRPWTGLHWAQDNSHDEEQEGAEQSLRRLLKLRHGLGTTWQADGLSCNFNSRLKEQFQDRKRKRTANRGNFSYRAVLELPLQAIRLRTATGDRASWAISASLQARPTVDKVGEVLSVHYVGSGNILFLPTRSTLPLPSKAGHQFRELCLSILTQFPELVTKRYDDDHVTVTHQFEDKHHLVQVHNTGTETQIRHSWASTSQIVPWDRDQSTLQEAIANFLEVEPKTTWIVPHPEIHRIFPLWAGKRRWTQTRARYKKLIKSKRSSAADAAVE
ncbi:hypothetical protein JG687_00015926 [Phytophthora cactorum]|uniref:Uncharacterized protein n=1 Tax=Phytophthora cactorum TaxID=29920 RepID=A0A8T1TXF4_9STRA|nr:hypothetical protein PC120_g12051 [Phytophthora cactorum]KAG6947716.1 hypothetical protein JG687_00015926 [Phytophthora cactorum]